MIIKKMLNLFKSIAIILVLLLSFQKLNANEQQFNKWLTNFKEVAYQKGISKETINSALKDAKYLKNVIVYDNRQPEFFEVTNVYISKRANSRSLNKAKKYYKKYKNIFLKVEKEFKVEKELILALWSIETNFGNNFGKMDIISSLATLSFDKRRSAYFTGELLTLLSLIDKKVVTKDILFGSWAGALGNFQFMPSTIDKYGIDYDQDNKIDLKYSLNDSIASAANYLNKAGWKYNNFCFTKVNFTKKIDKSYFNHSARNIKKKNNLEFWKKIGISGFKNTKNIENIKKFALVLPDGDESSPKYLVSENYEKVLKWNRSLRFALTVCTLKDMIANEI